MLLDISCLISNFNLQCLRLLFQQELKVLEGESKKSAQDFCITFQKVSLLVLSYTSIGQNEMFQGLKCGIVRLSTLKILGDIGKNRIHQFFVFRTFS